MTVHEIAHDAAKSLLEVAQQNIQSNPEGYLCPVAFLFKSDRHPLIVNMHEAYNGTVKHKRVAYAKVAALAKENQADFLITLNDCMWREQSPNEPIPKSPQRRAPPRSDCSVDHRSDVRADRAANEIHQNGHRREAVVHVRAHPGYDEYQGSHARHATGAEVVGRQARVN